jgi:hypothetical protein
MKAAQGLIALSTVFVYVISALVQPVEAETFAVSRTQAPGSYRGRLGDFDVVALSDGTAPRQQQGPPLTRSHQPDRQNWDELDLHIRLSSRVNATWSDTEQLLLSSFELRRL